MTCTGAAAVYPLDIAKTQLQMDTTGKYTGLFNALKVGPCVSLSPGCVGPSCASA